MNSAALPATLAKAEARPRIPVSVLLGVFWIYLFARNGFTDDDRNTFYLGSTAAPLFTALGPAILAVMGFLCVLEYRRLLYREFLFRYLAIAAMLILFAFSSVSNDQPAINAMEFFFGYLQYAILIPFTVLCIKDREIDFRTITKWVLIPILIQFLINLGWALKISPLQNQRRDIPNNLDWAYGTLTNTTEAAGLGCILIVFAFHLLVVKPAFAREYEKWKVFSLLASGALLLLWADSKLTYGAISMAIAIVSFFTIKARLLLKIQYTVGGFALLSGLFFGSIYYNFEFNSIYGSSVTFNDILGRTLAGGQLAIRKNPKIEVYQAITEKLPEDLDFPVFGGGPGNATSRFAIKHETPLANRYILPKIDWEQQHGNSMLLLPNTGFNALLGDIGWIGLVLYYSTLLVPLGAVYRNFINERYLGLQSTWAFVYLVFSTYIFLNSLIEDKLYLGTEVAFVWIMGILLHQRGLPPKGTPV